MCVIKDLYPYPLQFRRVTCQFCWQGGVLERRGFVGKEGVAISTLTHSGSRTTVSSSTMPWILERLYKSGCVQCRGRESSLGMMKTSVERKKGGGGT